MIFRKELNKPINATVSPEVVEDKPALAVGVVHLSACTVLLAISSYISWEMYLISAIFAISLFVSVSVLTAIRKKSFKPISSSFARLPYELIPFCRCSFWF